MRFALLIAIFLAPAAGFAAGEDMDVQKAAEIAGQTEPYKPSWIGWLHLPAPQERTGSIALGEDQPEFWKAWQRQGIKRMEWVPASFISADEGAVELIVYQVPGTNIVSFRKPDSGSKRKQENR